MNKEIKKLADAGDIKSLKYIFVDSLDVDPTFVQYEEEYNYCKSVSGLLEVHVELTPFSEDKDDWNEEYWTKLKMDLLKNFSDKRMSHMRDVAKVFLADKVQRILAERAANKVVQKSVVQKAESVQIEKVSNIPLKSDIAVKKTSVSKAELQARELEQERRRLKSENKAYEEEAAARRERQRQFIQTQPQNRDEFSKKAIGIAVAAIIVAVILILRL